jgi:hypothetical protein
MSSCGVPDDILGFCTLRNNRLGVDRIIQAGMAEGLSKEKDLLGYLESSDYISVLKAVWSERDKERRLTWLREHSSIHAPLMFEQALAEFVKAPSKETIQKVSMPLIAAATHRVHQDCLCHLFTAMCGSLSQDLATVYKNSLAACAKKYMSHTEDVPSLLQGDKEATREKVCQTMRACLSTSMPNPKWAKWPGQDVLFEIDDLTPEEWKSVRCVYAESVIKKFDKKT